MHNNIALCEIESISYEDFPHGNCERTNQYTPCHNASSLSCMLQPAIIREGAAHGEVVDRNWSTHGHRGGNPQMIPIHMKYQLSKV